MGRTKKTEQIVYSHLSGDDQDDLAWFFGGGQVAFERSVFGYQLERAELRTFGSRVCPKCDGAGYTEDPEKAIREAIAKAERWQRENEKALSSGKNPKRLPDWYTDGSCALCAGSGWVPQSRRHPRGGAITAQPIHSETRNPPAEPASDDLERYGFVSDQIRRLDEQAVQTIAAFFGMAGERNEHDKDRGRIFGVYALTPAGKKLLKMAGKQADDRMTPPLVIENQATLEMTQRKPHRAQLLESARTQAEKRLRDAEADWKRERPRGGRKRKAGPRRIESVEDVRIAARFTSKAFGDWMTRCGDTSEDYRCAV